MKTATTIAMLSGLLAIGAQAFAQDAATGSDTSKSSSSKSQMMKECMDKQKATNASLTHDARMTVCKNEIEKRTKNGNDLASGPQGDKPQK